MDSVWESIPEKVKLENKYKQKKNRFSYEKNLHLHPGHPTDHRQK